MKKMKIIDLYNNGKSIRKIADELSISRITVKKYVDAYSKELSIIQSKQATDDEKKAAQGRMFEAPKYDSKSRSRRLATKEVIAAIEDCLAENERRKAVGLRKQIYDGTEIYNKLKNDGFALSYSLVTLLIRELKKTHKECFIRQEYSPGESAQFDYGEIKLNINGELKKVYMAVFSIQSINYRFCTLYYNANQESMFDAHNRFFAHLNGIPKEVVYDNMRNVVSSFIGREKNINLEALKMATYFGFKIRLTNCRKGNEKGHVEESVRYIRKKLFVNRIDFDSLESANEYLMQGLMTKINHHITQEDLQKETDALGMFNGIYNFERRVVSKVNAYSCIVVNGNFYSVPDHLIDREVHVAIGVHDINIYCNDIKVASHKKIQGTQLYSIVFDHYLNTFIKKPGAIKNSLALKQLPERLRALFNSYYTSFPKEFIDFFMLTKTFGVQPLLDLVEDYMKKSVKLPSRDYIISVLNADKEGFVGVKERIEKNKYAYDVLC